jgi:hypothetical protein
VDLKDLFLTPLYLGLFYMIAFAVRPAFTNKYTKPYFIPALTLKFIGAIGLGIIYQFYYGGGDTFNYFSEAKIIGSAFSESFSTGIKLIFATNRDFDPQTAPFVTRMTWGPGSHEFMVSRLAGLFGMLCFNTYSIIGLGFAIVSFSGIWALYITFVKFRPLLYRQLAWTVFYVPSLFFWGSGILKDSVCVGALGWLFYAFYKGTVQKRSLLSSTLIGIGAASALAAVKIYILLCFLPAALLWVFNENNARIKSPILRILAKPLFFGVGALVAVFALTNLTKGDEEYDLDKIGERSKITADYLYRVSVEQNGSAYTLGEQDGTIGGMVKLAPQAIATSLFRPFLWEAHNPVMLLSALEAAFFLFFTLRIFYRTGVVRTFSIIAQTPMLTLCFVFSLVFSASVAITSSNFGTLVRYKIPMMPFYLAGLYMLESLATTNIAKKGMKPVAIPVRRQPQLT